MNRTRRAPATLAGLATLATAAGVLLSTATPSLASDGTAALASASGGLSSAPTFVTSGPCKNANATNIQVAISGGDAGAHIGAANIVGNQPISVYPTNANGGYNIPAPQSWGDFFNSRNITSPSGVYTFTVVCRTASDGTDLGDFSGTVQWASGHYSAPAEAPTVTSGPRLSGTVRVGSRVTCAVTFNGATSVTYAWLKSGTAIPGATDRTYRIADSVFGHTLACRATGRNGVGPTRATSAAAKVARGPALAVVHKPVLSGPHVHGQVETASTGSWSPAATSYSYQWFVGTHAVSGATSHRFTIPKSAVGKTISCVVKAHRHGWGTGSARTAGVKVTK